MNMSCSVKRERCRWIKENDANTAYFTQDYQYGKMN